MNVLVSRTIDGHQKCMCRMGRVRFTPGEQASLEECQFGRGPWNVLLQGRTACWGGGGRSWASGGTPGLAHATTCQVATPMMQEGGRIRPVSLLGWLVENWRDRASGFVFLDPVR